jgi:hypothetical protein
MVGVRISKELRRRIERWARTQSGDYSLSGAIRQLVELGLTGPKRKTRG